MVWPPPPSRVCQPPGTSGCGPDGFESAGFLASSAKPLLVRGTLMRPNVAARLGGWSARHRKTAIFGWVLFVVAAVLIGGMAGQQRLTNGEQGTGDSARAERILDDAGIK